MMKKLKFLMCALFAVLACAAFTACGDDDDDEPAGGSLHPLTGTWIGMDGSSERMYVFNENGSGYTKRTASGSRVDNFTDYKVENGKLLIKWEGDNDYDDKGAIQINGNKFKLNINDDGNWYEFSRQ